ncbi:MAG: hypothetical protein WCT41_00365 [Candidatus Paceibacterota bacterium]|jgi:hypothetical protein
MEDGPENRALRSKNAIDLEIMGLRIKLQQLETKTAIGGSTEIKALIESAGKDQEVQRIETKIEELRQEKSSSKA